MKSPLLMKCNFILVTRCTLAHQYLEIKENILLNSNSDFVFTDFEFQISFKNFFSFLVIPDYNSTEFIRLS